MLPEFLYHYTSIESLALILSSRKIRFNSLSQVDDLMEGKSKDYRFIGNYYFISSWTDLERESLPFWNMYTPNMKGVRIKMPVGMFCDYLVSTKGCHGLAHGIFNSIIPDSETFNTSYWIPPTQNNYLSKVEYTDDTNLLFPIIRTMSGDEFKVHLGEVGRYKSKHWEFQSEWRFIINVFPTTSVIPAYTNQVEPNILSNSLYSMKKGDRLPFSDYFVNIDESKLRWMEILLGPKHNQADRVIVESLIKHYNPDANLAISDLYRKVK